MDEQLASYFLEKATAAFGFLTTDHSFSAPQVQVAHDISFAFVTFLATNVAVECVLDSREEDVTCKIARVVDGRKLGQAGVDEPGVREGIPALLRRRGVRERLFTRVGAFPFRERIAITLEDFASMLKAHFKEVLDDLPSVFP
jgi:hypothetical protein